MRKLSLALAFGALLGAPAFADPKIAIEVGGSTSGTVVVNLRPDLAPKHVERIVELVKAGAYDGVAFHRVIDDFMAQTGDVEFGKGEDLSRAGMGGSNLPDLPAEFSKTAKFERGTVGMARSQSPNSANSQFFINFVETPHLNGQYTIVGEVESGMEVIDAVKKGKGGNGSVSNPDRMVKVTVLE